MIIKKLIVKNYRALDDITFEFGEDYSTLSGHNNAGKSCVVELLMNLFSGFEVPRFEFVQYRPITYNDDYTQWREDKEDIEVRYDIEINETDDPMLCEFVRRTSQIDVSDRISITIVTNVSKTGRRKVDVKVGTQIVDEVAADSIVQKIGSTKTVFYHNSTISSTPYYSLHGRANEYIYADFTDEEEQEIKKSEKTVQNKIKKLAKSHKDDINSVLGKLSQKFDVELSTPDFGTASRRPLIVSLGDKNVQAPLGDWGSGTQNRTRILMSIINAKRQIGTSERSRVTPVILIEEPESFLHPNAQAEFGRIIEELSKELGVQIIAATHSPYMLNQKTPKNNLLLRRKIVRNKAKGTYLEASHGDNWMTPFAEHLSIVPPEFDAWKALFGLGQGRVVFVEGQIDVEYFEHLRSNYNDLANIDDDIKFVPYDGKDSLKNTTLLKFVLRNVKNKVITFDLDAQTEAVRALSRIGLEHEKDYFAIGLPKPGRDRIEGLLPPAVTGKVMSGNPDLTFKLQSHNSSEVRAAKSEFKNKCLDEFKKTKLTKEDISEFLKVIRKILKAFKSQND